MSHVDVILSAFRKKQASVAQEESAQASELRANLLGLKEHPGWAILVTHLTRTRDILYRKMEDGTASDTERALAKLCRQLLEGPAALIEAATTVLRDAATPQ